MNDRIYASDANSTAYKYPLADASILSVKGKPAGAAPLLGGCTRACVIQCLLACSREQ